MLTPRCGTRILHRYKSLGLNLSAGAAVTNQNYARALRRRADTADSEDAKAALRERATRACEAALQALTALRGSEHPDVCDAMRKLANAHRVQGNVHQASTLLREAIGTLVKTVPMDERTAAALNDLALLIKTEGVGNLYEAEALYVNAIKIADAARSKRNSIVYNANLAELWDSMGKTTEAQQLRELILARHSDQVPSEEKGAQ